MSKRAPAARAAAAALSPIGDSVDRILADWDRERPDLDFSPVAVVTRLHRVRAHLDAGLARVFAAHDLSAADLPGDRDVAPVGAARSDWPRRR